jgi:signal transduction histidine kinase
MHGALDPTWARALVSSLRSGLLAVDDGLRITALSDEGARILGVENLGPLLGRTLDEVLPDQVGLCRLIREALQGRDAPSRAEWTLEEGGATTRTIGFTLAPVRQDGEVIGASLLFRDLTSFEREDEQERLRDRLAALGEMAAGLAHEIRNPLASIELLAGLVKRAAPDDVKVRDLVSELVAEVHSVAETVRAALDFVRPRSPIRQPTRVAVVLHEAVRRARACRPNQVVLDVTCGDALEVNVDPDQLRTIAGNLVENALSMLDPDAAGNTSLQAMGDGSGGLHLIVDDSGPGVPPDLRERIFYPFFTTRAEGTGVGLAEVQKLVVAHAGSVEVTDSPLGGARFTVHLPPRSDA